MSNQLNVLQDEGRQLATNESLLSPANFNHYIAVAEFLSKSTFVPKNMIGKPSDILIAMEMGQQLGLPSMQALQDIAVINGKPALFSDGLLAVVQNHPHYEFIREEPIIKEGTVYGYACTVKRKGHDEHTVVFTLDDARKAQLLGKPGPWTQYPSRMLQMRARGFAIRNTFADALRGMKSAEEVADYVEADYREVSHETPQSQSQRVISSYKQRKGIQNENTTIDVSPATSEINETFLSEDAEPVTSEENSHQVDDRISAVRAALQNPAGVQQGEAMVYSESEQTGEPISKESILLLDTLIKEKLEVGRIKNALKHYGVRSIDELSEESAQKFITQLQNMRT